MKLSSYLDPKLIFTDITGETKEEIIETLIERVGTQDKKVKKMEDEVKRAVLAREGEISTALGGGLAIPHGRIDAFDDFVVAIGVLKDPVKCKMATQDKEDDVNLFILIISEVLKNKKMLKMMSGFMKIATKNPDVIRRVKESQSPQEIFDLIKSAEVEIDGKITAEDVLSPDVTSVKPTDTLEEIAKKLILEGRIGLPVLDDSGNFLGEITEKELIEFGMPKYMSVMQDISFLTVGEPFEEYLKKEKITTIEHLYREEDIVKVDRKASIMEVCFLMVNKGKTRIYVVEDKKYYGVIERGDIIKKVLHI